MSAPNCGTSEGVTHWEGCDCQKARTARLESLCRRLMEALKLAEWAAPFYYRGNLQEIYGECVECGTHQDDGHDSSCPIGQVLKDAKEVLG